MPIIATGNQVSSSAQMSPDVVLKGNIKDGEIENADIAAAAAIAFTKLAGVAAKGANSDITSLTGLTTPLSVPQGGTGKATITAHKLIVGNGTSAPAEVDTGSATQVLTSNGASADPTFQIINFNSLSAAAASANVRTSDDTQVNSNAYSAYTKVKEILFADSAGTVRVTFHMNLVTNGNGSDSMYARTYKNGVALGTARTISGGSNGNFTYDETGDFTFVAGDLIQVYAYGGQSSGANAYITNFRLLYDKIFSPAYTTNTVNL